MMKYYTLKYLLAASFAALVSMPSISVAQTTHTDECLMQVFFPNDVSTLTTSQINQVTDFVRGSTTDVIAVNGFASDAGDSDYNVALSQRRSRSVGMVIVGAGEQIAASGFGENGPGALARRVDILRDDCAIATMDMSINARVLTPLFVLAVIAAAITMEN